LFTPLKKRHYRAREGSANDSKEDTRIRQKKGDYTGTLLRYTQILKEVGMTDHTKV